MAIAFNCPHCQFAYRLKDELAGKQAKCKNPDCRRVITIPTPATVPPDAPARDAAAVEADALSALADEVAGPADEAPPEKVIPMTCEFCGHKWTEPWSKAGKNTLCPSPECRRRLKVPEPKEDVPTDWRQQRSKLPSLAKQHHEKLEGVQDAGDVKLVTGDSLRKADATGEEVEPRPLKDKVLIGLTVFGLLAAVGFGVWYWRSSSAEKGEDQLMAEARAGFDQAAGELTPADAGLCSAVLHAAAAEHALRHDTADGLKSAHDLLGKARDEVRKQPPGPTRNAVAAELAVAVLALGGTDDQVRQQVRYRWQPDPAAVRTGRLNERVHTVHDELRQTLTLLALAEFDFKVAVARRLARELAARGQAAFAAELLPLALFSPAEHPEARAAVALEVFRADKGSDVPRRVADELKAGAGKGALPASAQTLFWVLGADKPPPDPGPGAAEPAVLAHVGLRLLEGKPDAALDLARRAPRPDTQLKALALCAEWSPDPGPAVLAAADVVGAAKGRKDVVPASYLLRLSRAAAAAGRPDPARALADAVADDGLRVWARGDAVRLRAAANPKERADPEWVGEPRGGKDQRAGHAWGRLWVARQNARESGDKAKERKAAADAPAAMHPFALAGIALGLKDR